MHSENIVFSAYRLLDSIIRSIVSNNESIHVKYCPNGNSTRNVCIILDKGLGDFILFAFYLRNIIDFLNDEGLHVTIIADEYNVHFLNEYIEADVFQTIILRNNSVITSEGNDLSKYRGMYQEAIIPMNAVTPRSAEIVRILSPNIVISLGNSRFLRKYSINDYKVFSKITTYSIDEKFYCCMHRELFQKITGKDVGLSLLSPLFYTEKHEKNYFIINVSASNQVKLLAFDKFINLGRKIAKSTGLTPLLLGDLNLSDVSENIKKEFNCNYLNCRNLSITADLCHNAAFVITSDTGIYHLALSIADGPMVFIPTWSYVNILFEPYPDSMAESKRVRYIRMYATCDECPENGIRCFYKKCMKKTVHCVSDMSVDFVFNSLRSYI